jgi:hypothetical protein
VGKLIAKAILFNEDKNAKLKAERGVGFEDVILAIEESWLLDDLRHKNPDKYPNQNIFVVLVKIKNYVYAVPYVEDEATIFLKTIIPSRKLNGIYNKGGKGE